MKNKLFSFQSNYCAVIFQSSLNVPLTWRWSPQGALLFQASGSLKNVQGKTNTLAYFAASAVTKK